MIAIKEKLDLDEISNCDDTITVGLTMQEELWLEKKIAETTKSLKSWRSPFQKQILPLIRFQVVKVQPYISGALPQFDVVTSISKQFRIFTNFRAKIVSTSSQSSRDWCQLGDKNIGRMTIALTLSGVWTRGAWDTIEEINSPLTHSLAGMKKSWRLMRLKLKILMMKNHQD